MSEVTVLLNAAQPGDPHAAAQLLPLVYDELRRLAAHRLAHEAPGQTLQPTALVHEAYLRLVGDQADTHWDGRGHFFSAADEAMRRILVENARRKRSFKRGGDRARLPPGPGAKRRRMQARSASEGQPPPSLALRACIPVPRRRRRDRLAVALLRAGQPAVHANPAREHRAGRPSGIAARRHPADLADAGGGRRRGAGPAGAGGDTGGRALPFPAPGWDGVDGAKPRRQGAGGTAR
jgi:hypothetical protein